MLKFKKNTMITLEQKNKLIEDFKIKFENNTAVVLEAWDESHYAIPKIINEKNYKKGIEIGCAFGGHLEKILSTTNIEKLYGVDPYAFYSNYEKENDALCMKQDILDYICNFVKINLSYYNNRFELIRDYSANSANLFYDNSLDFVYIDGNHSYEYVNKDLTLWWPKIKSGGMLCGHDYNHSCIPQVTQCVDNFFKQLGKPVLDLNDHNWCVYKD